MPKPDIERAIFEAFLRARGLQCASDEIQQPDPPAPDILWRPAEGAQVAFELTEVVETNAAKHRADADRAARACWDVFCELPAHQQAALRGRSYYIGVHPRVGAKRLIELCKRVVQALPDLSDSFDPSGLTRIRVPVADLEPPIDVQVSEASDHTSFSPDRTGTWLERCPTLRAVNSKLSKTYTSDGALELLAYFSKQHSGYFDRFERSELESRFDSEAERAPFQRIWVFDRRRGVILALFPRRDAAALGVDIVSADPDHGLLDDVEPTPEIQKPL
jgi:hypothetical protein